MKNSRLVSRALVIALVLNVIVFCFSVFSLRLLYKDENNILVLVGMQSGLAKDEVVSSVVQQNGDRISLLSTNAIRFSISVQWAIASLSLASGSLLIYMRNQAKRDGGTNLAL